MTLREALRIRRRQVANLQSAIGILSCALAVLVIVLVVYARAAEAKMAEQSRLINEYREALERRSR